MLEIGHRLRARGPTRGERAHERPPGDLWRRRVDAADVVDHRAHRFEPRVRDDQLLPYDRDGRDDREAEEAERRAPLPSLLRLVGARRLFVPFPVISHDPLLDRAGLEAADKIGVRAERERFLVTDLRDDGVLGDLAAPDQAQHGAAVEGPPHLRLAQPDHPT